jgi:hypothetical protein
LEFALILKHVKFPVNFYFALDLNYSEDLELILENYYKERGGWREASRGGNVQKMNNPSPHGFAVKRGNGIKKD